jgi:hypothetical protein
MGFDVSSKRRYEWAQYHFSEQARRPGLRAKEAVIKAACKVPAANYNTFLAKDTHFLWAAGVSGWSAKSWSTWYTIFLSPFPLTLVISREFSLLWPRVGNKDLGDSLELASHTWLQLLENLALVNISVLAFGMRQIQARCSKGNSKVY